MRVCTASPTPIVSNAPNEPDLTAFRELISAMKTDRTQTLDANTAREVEATVAGFFVALDRSDYDSIIDRVTDDVVWIRPSGTFHGKQAFRKVLETRSRSRVTRHLVPRIDFEGVGKGKVTARFEVLIFEKIFDGEPSLPATISGPSMVLGIEDDLVQEAEGGPWLISRKVGTVIFHIKP